ncbi:hypothetical protein [Marasmitruncus massiliensis]|uniref:hypothetical protein n=1 Tax=Marasmitruncus massiliensis TaxID=1944642 RepID=UPI0011AEF47E|nr:hypothetical protein [Marasmitruncus massiliensis]
MKKIMALLSAAIIAGAFVACSSEESKSVNADTSSVSESSSKTNNVAVESSESDSSSSEEATSSEVESKSESAETASNSTTAVDSVETDTSFTPGYSTITVRYVDPQGNPIKMTNTASQLKTADAMYANIEQAKEAGMLVDYTDLGSVMKFKQKGASTFVWTITPADTSSIPNWTDNKANIPVTMTIDENVQEREGNVSEYIVTCDYSTEVVAPTMQVNQY